MRFERETYSDDKIELDGNSYENCVFRNCTFVFRGKSTLSIVGCEFHGDIRFVLEDAAAHTVNFMKALYAGGFKPTVEATFDEIRGNNS